ncbi:MAG: hypothetical protein LBV58_04830 [Acholeplasmatales bacterium]|jgi:hypothetical protein|nr:hypothetical protein [Acholeplasmatales bacterium]
MKLLITIVNRNVINKVVALLNDKKVNFSVDFLGKGSASTEILDTLGIFQSEKSVVFSLVNDDSIDTIFESYKDDLDLLSKGTGVSFAINLDSISKSSLDAILNKKEEL